MVSLGPGLFSCADIARQLSVGGRVVRLSPELEDAGAFVYLKPRPWSEVCSLLCRGMDLSLKKVGDTEDQYLLGRDAEVMDRDRHLRRLFVHNVRARMLEGIQRSIALMNEPSDLVGSRMTDLKRRLETMVADKKDDTPEYLAALAEYRWVHMAFGWGPVERLVAQWLSGAFPSETDFETLFSQGYVCWSSPIQDLPQGLLAPALRQLGPRAAEQQFDYIIPTLQLQVGPEGIRAAIGLYLYSTNSHDFQSLRGVYGMDIPIPEPDYAAPPGTALDWIFGGGLSRTPMLGRFPGLGTEARRWLENERAKTKAFLSSSGAKEPLAPSAGMRDSISQWISDWSRQHDAEAIMELAPNREILECNGGSKSLTARSLSELFMQERGDLATAWTLDSSSGVLLVHDQLSFLSRPRKRPVAALIKFLRGIAACIAHGHDEPANGVQEAATRERASHGYPYTLLSTYAREVAAEPHTYWSFPPAPVSGHTYHGCELAELDHAVGLVYLWDHLSTSEREVQSLAASGVTERKEFPLSRFGPGILHNFTRLWQSWGNWDWDSVLPDAEARSRTLSLVVVVREAEGNPDKVKVMLITRPQQYAMTAEFLWSPTQALAVTGFGFLP